MSEKVTLTGLYILNALLFANCDCAGVDSIIPGSEEREVEEEGECYIIDSNPRFYETLI